MAGRGAPLELLQRIWQTDARFCAQCWNPVFLAQAEDGTAALVCPNGCEPGGHVSEPYVVGARIQDRILAREAAANYPALALLEGREDLLPNRARLARDVDALFGEGAGSIANPDGGKRRDNLPPQYVRRYWTQGE